jgi:predicted  nucleic acid-binding Zn-ribbon protein
MAHLDALLADAEKTHKEMQSALQADAGKTARDIVSLRTKFATLMSEIIPAMKSDARLQANPDLSREFESRFLEIRQSLAQHQAKFRMASIESDLPGYRSSVEEIRQLQEEFYTWTRSAL